MSGARAVGSASPESFHLGCTDGVVPSSQNHGDDLKFSPLNQGDKNLNPPDIGFLDLLREDIKTYDYDVMSPGLWVVAIHRFGNCAWVFAPSYCERRSACFFGLSPD